LEAVVQQEQPVIQMVLLALTQYFLPLHQLAVVVVPQKVTLVVLAVQAAVVVTPNLVVAALQIKDMQAVQALAQLHLIMVQAAAVVLDKLVLLEHLLLAVMVAMVLQLQLLAHPLPMQVAVVVVL
jgi:hypothetical protein